jgi:transposase
MSDGSTPEDSPRHPGGRPSKYDPAFCDVVLKEMANGLSLTAVSAIIGVTRATINNWMAEYPEFLEAVTRAKANRLLHWERVALNVASQGGGPGSATVVVFGLKNMGGDEWSDTTKTEVSGPGGGPIKTEETSARDIIAGKLSRLTAARPAAGDTGEPD